MSLKGIYGSFKLLISDINIGLINIKVIYPIPYNLILLHCNNTIQNLDVKLIIGGVRAQAFVWVEPPSLYFLFLITSTECIIS